MPDRSPSGVLPYEGVEGTVADLFQVRTVPFAFHGARLRFDLAATVFASAGIDPGSALLLRHLQTLLKEWDASDGGAAGGGIRRVLDLGCGHGILGLTLLALDPERHVTLVDRDALALAFTARNLALNGLPPHQAHITGSLGYDDVDRSEPFDLVVSNIPGKAGDAAIAELVAAPEPWGRVGTLVAVVVVAPLADQVRRVLDPGRFELMVDTGTKAHQVLIARRTAADDPIVPVGAGQASGFEAGRYDRQRSRFQTADLAWEADTVTGIEEFDSLSHATRLLRPALRGLRAGPCTLVNPGQGHRALIAARSGQRLTDVVSRDLLALRATDRLLADNGVPPAGSGSRSVTGEGPEGVLTAFRHGLSVPPPARFATVIVHADDKVHTPWLAHELRELIRAGTGLQLVLTGRASLLGRLEADLLSRHGGRLFYKQGRDGYRVLRYQYRPPA